MRLARAPAQQSALGGGSGTSSERAGASTDMTEGQPREGAWPTNIPGSSKARMIFDVSGCCATGECAHEASLAALTARQMLQGLAGSKVSLAAEATDSVLEYPANILAHAKPWATSSMAPLAQSQAQSRDMEASRRDTPAEVSGSAVSPQARRFLIRGPAGCHKASSGRGETASGTRQPASPDAGYPRRDVPSPPAPPRPARGTPADLQAPWMNEH